MNITRGAVAVCHPGFWPDDAGQQRHHDRHRPLSAMWLIWHRGSPGLDLPHKICSHVSTRGQLLISVLLLIWKLDRYVYISNIYAHISASQISNILEMCLHWETRIPRVSDNLSGPQPWRSGASVHLYLSPQTAWFLPGPLSDTARWSCRLRRAVGVTATGIGSDSGANFGGMMHCKPGVAKLNACAQLSHFILN